jgi:8-oxo-dGTP diphosphatase
VSGGAETDEVVRAAGGVVLRGERALTEVLLVHRPRYDDWSLPKGKLHAGEDDVEAAVREVREETGIACRPDGEIGRTRYVDPRGRDKEVVYFRMSAERDEGFAPNNEVDDVRWVPVDDAPAVLTWSRDAEIVRAAMNR